MKNRIWLAVFAGLAAWGVVSNSAWARGEAKKLENVWRPQPSVLGDGLLAERVNLWRTGRMMYMIDAEEEYLLSGFESRPGRHPWQGEHFGKWLHAATLAYEQTHDEKLLKQMQAMIERLLATQDANGYMGTYGADHTFMAMPENVSIRDVADDVAPNKKKKGRKNAGGWDTWTLRYNMYGLLTFEKVHPDTRIVKACRKMADLLIEVYGEGKYDLTKYGTRQGISATTLLESIMMLYERTQEQKYLDFAEHIVAMSENNPKLRLMGTMLENGSVVGPGEGKAYQLMANLLGYGLLYKATGDERYLKTVTTAWEKIKKDHTYTTGGPWGIKKEYNGNRECFAYPKDFDPVHADVETCSTTTWIQMNLHLLELTGEAKYAAEAERALFNALLGAQYREGIDWCYYTKANQDHQPYEEKISCCASSGPRALEMFAHYVVGKVDCGVSFATLVPGSVALPAAFGNAEIKVTGNYPVDPKVGLRFEKADDRHFAVEFREPSGARLASVKINDESIKPNKNDRGFYRLYRTWKKGDAISIEFDYLLKSHFELPQDGRQWVAFTYGPWALANRIKRGAAFNEPFAGKDASAKAATHWLEPDPVDENGLPNFRIKGTDIVLEPYFATGSLETGPQTYFQVEGIVAVKKEKKPLKPQPVKKKRKGTAGKRADILKDVAAFAPGWTVVDCGAAMTPGLKPEWGGRKNVLLTHPLSQGIPCILQSSLEVPAGKTTHLKLTLSNDKRGDFRLAVKANGKAILGKDINTGRWQDISVDLSEYAGQSITLELLNQATGWKFEGGYWARIAVESK